MQISRQHTDANGSLTYQLSDSPDRTLHLQSLGTMILKIICSFPLWRKNALRITLPCIPVSISGRLSLLTPCQKPRRWSKFDPLSSPAIRKEVDRHSTWTPPNQTMSAFLPSIKRTTTAGSRNRWFCQPLEWDYPLNSSYMSPPWIIPKLKTTTSWRCCTRRSLGSVYMWDMSPSA